MAWMADHRTATGEILISTARDTARDFVVDTPQGDRAHEVVAELRRYRPGHLAVAPEIAHLPVFGTYPIKDPDRSLAMLETVMPIQVRRPLSWWVSIEPK
jgi:ferric-dicitrate binding protein FerR (iron transport regulator)